MRSLLTLAAIGLCSIPLFAQESYWIANRLSNDLSEVDPGGNTLRTIALSNNLRSCHVAPDGKVWVVQYSPNAGTILIVDPSVNPPTQTPVTFNQGTGGALAIAFDKNGHAWVTSGSTATVVEEFDANGTSLSTYTVAASGQLITVDNQGNKWIAHRIAQPLASVSRIDAVTGAVTNHPIPTVDPNTSQPISTTMLPVDVIADYQSPGTPSNIWLSGDNSGEVAKFDIQGNFLGIFFVSSDRLTGLATDLNSHVWALARGGQLYKLAQGGNVLSTYVLSVVDTRDVTTDTLGRLWVTDIACTMPPCPPAIIQRIAPSSGMAEAKAEVGQAAQSMLSTPFHYCAVVDPMGDLDGDMETNLQELLALTSPADDQSNVISLATLGVSQLGGTVNIEFQNNDPIQSSVSTIAISAGIAPPITLGGINGAIQIAVPVIGFTPVQFNTYSIPIAIPNAPSVVGVSAYLQAIAILNNTPNPLISNRTSIRAWN